jgi:hypothetical protein
MTELSNFHPVFHLPDLFNLSQFNLFFQPFQTNKSRLHRSLEFIYLIPLFGLSGRLLSFDDVFVNGIAETEEIYLR